MSCQEIGPVLVVTLVLAVGGAALWLVLRSGPADAQLVDVLLDEVTGQGPSWLTPLPAPERPLLGHGQQDELQAEPVLVPDEPESCWGEQLHEIATGIAQADELPAGDELARVLDSAAGLTRYEAEGAFSCRSSGTAGSTPRASGT